MDTFSILYLPYPLKGYLFSPFWQWAKWGRGKLRLAKVIQLSVAQTEFRVLELLKWVIPRSSRSFFQVISENWSGGRAQFLSPPSGTQIWRTKYVQFSQACLTEARPFGVGSPHSHLDWASHLRSHRFWLLSSVMSVQGSRPAPQVLIWALGQSLQFFF